MSCAAQSEIGPDQGALPYNALMSEKNTLTLRRADQARTDFALIEDHLEFIAGQLGGCRHGPVSRGRSRYHLL